MTSITRSFLFLSFTIFLLLFISFFFFLMKHRITDFFNDVKQTLCLVSFLSIRVDFSFLFLSSLTFVFFFASVYNIRIFFSLFFFVFRLTHNAVTGCKNTYTHLLMCWFFFRIIDD